MVSLTNFSINQKIIDNKGENTMTKKELLKMIRSDLKKWSKTKDGKSYKRFYKKYKETK